MNVVMWWPCWGHALQWEHQLGKSPGKQSKISEGEKKEKEKEIKKLIVCLQEHNGMHTHEHHCLREERGGKERGGEEGVYIVDEPLRRRGWCSPCRRCLWRRRAACR